MRIITLLVACALAVAITACNTVRGVGQDVQKAGTAIEKAVK